MERLTLEGSVCVQAYTDFCDEQEDCLSCPYGDRSFVRLAAYEDTGLEPEEVQIVAKMFAGDPYVPILQVSNLVKAYREGRGEILPPNDPLTLEELREMDGEYVYAVLPSGFGNRWAFVQVLSEGRNGIHLMYHDGASSAGFLLDCGAKFYRRKPEGNA